MAKAPRAKAAATQSTAASKPAPAPAPRPTPAPAPAEAASVLPAAQEAAQAAAPVSEPTPNLAPASAIAEPSAEPPAVSEAVQTPESSAPTASTRHEGPEDRLLVLDRAQDALRAALDGLADVARHGGFAAGSPAEQGIAAAAEQGFAAVSKALMDAEQSIGVAVSALRYEGLERRSFELVKDVLLDGTYYGPSHDKQAAALTEGQHAELKDALAVEGEWADGEPVEAE